MFYIMPRAVGSGKPPYSYPISITRDFLPYCASVCASGMDHLYRKHPNSLSSSRSTQAHMTSVRYVMALPSKKIF